MKIIKPTKVNIYLAGRLLKKGAVIVYPTDTAYALGGVYDNKNIIKKILAIKKRKDGKFTLIASSQYQVEKFFTLNRTQIQIAKKYWPGPLSLVVSKKYAVRVPDSAVARKLARLAGKPLIATSANIHGEKTPYSIRTILKFFSPSPLPLSRQGRGRVSRDYPLPLAACLPARQGEGGPNECEGRVRGINCNTPDLILDAGALPKRKTSTIVEVRGNKIKIIRPGAIQV